MKPIRFKHYNAVLAEDQPEYLPLPVYQTNDETISCWQFTLWERLTILFTGCVWLRQLNFGKPLQPQCPQVKAPLK